MLFVCLSRSVFGALKSLNIAETYIKRLEGSTLTDIITTSETITSIAVDTYGKALGNSAIV